jgi:hypothetical protein
LEGEQLMSHRTRKTQFSTGRTPSAVLREEEPMSVAARLFEPTQTDCTRSLADRIEAMDHALKVKELAAILSWSPTLLYNRARTGCMGRAVIRVGGTVRFDPWLTAQWLRSITEF